MQGSDDRTMAPPRRRPARAGWWFVLAVLPLAAGGCTSLGMNSGWSLATAGHVAATTAAAEARMQDQMESQVNGLVDQAMEADRKRMQALSDQLATAREQLDATSQTLEAAQTDRAALRTAVTQSLTNLAAVSAQLERVMLDMDTRMSALPAETLRELSEAIDLQLQAIEQEQAAETGGDATATSATAATAASSTASPATPATTKTAAP